MDHKGFTLIELVMVIVLVGILAVFVAPQLGNLFTTKSGALAGKLRADIRYAQNLAMTRNQRVRVAFAANSYSITIAGNPIADPATGRNYPVMLGAGDYVGISITVIGFTGSYVEFNSLGVPYDGATGGTCTTAPCPLTADKSVTVTGGQTVLVTAQTGAVN